MEGKQYISQATRFDIYTGERNWHDLPLFERETIARHELEGMPADLDIQEFVMGTNLRRIQFDGLRTVIVSAALALEGKLGVDFASDDGARYSLILPYLESTALGQELVSLLNGTAGDHTNYRMAELEFLAQSGSRASPLDRLLDLPRNLRLQGILELLRPKGAFDRQPKTADQSAGFALGELSFSETIPLLEARQLNMRASYSGSLQAVSQGAAKVGAAGTLAGVGFWAAPITGLIAAFFVAWWWLLIGLIIGAFAFSYSRKAAVKAVLRRACVDEAFFEAMRQHQIIWLEPAHSK
ncbi:hypothetical protein [Bradyrhizobium elkanii]|uniref:hypothetical protein n=1 Tax=Bradyrhizobium elkanii TaxID=29448 RepID=UPI003517A48D